MALTTHGANWRTRIEKVWTALAGEQPLADSFAERLCQLLDLTVTWNGRVDLTAARDSDELVDLNLADAVVLACASEPLEMGSSWLDVGSGAGAPGVPLALIRPELSFRLCEPRDKRVAFLRTSLAALNRSDVKVERCRSSELKAAMCDVAISRATLPPDQWLPEGARLAKSGVWVLLARGEAPVLEGWSLAFERTYMWPLTGVSRRALCFSKNPPNPPETP